MEGFNIGSKSNLAWSVESFHLLKMFMLLSAFIDDNDKYTVDQTMLK